MSAENEAVVRRFCEEMNDGRTNGLAAELFTADHQMHDPQVSTSDGPDGMVAAVSTYQIGVDGRWEINDIFSSDDMVVARWTGTEEHVAELNGIAPTGKKIDVSAISIRRMVDGKIANTSESGHPRLPATARAHPRYGPSARLIIAD